MRYFYANGAIHPFEDGEVPQWAKALGEDSDFRILSEDEADEYARQQGIKDRGFDMSAAQWSGSEQAMAVNPATGQMELIVNTPQGPMLTSQAAAAGIAGTPLMKPAEESSLSQWGEFLSAPPVALGLAAYGGANLLSGASGLGGGATGLEWLAGVDPMGAALSIPEGIGMGGAAVGGNSALDAALSDGFYSGANAANSGGINLANAGGTVDAGAAGIGGDALGGGIDWGALTAAEDAGLGAAFTEAGAGATAGSGFAGNVYGALGSGIGADLAASTAAANEAAAGAGMTAAGAGATAGGGALGNVYGTVGNAAAGTALSRILNGTGTTADWLSVGGNLAGAGLGAYASNKQASALDDLRQRYEGYGAPSRGRFEASMTPGFDPSTIPGYQGAVDNSMQTMLRKLSTQGNPFGNPGGLIEANKAVVAGTALPALQNYQGTNAAAGGFNTFNAAAPGAAQAALGANSNIYNSIGGGIANLTNPKSSLEEMLSKFGGKFALS